ncbi:MAG: polymer-forming cytoskeletal protein [Bacteroidia bacterium]|nr:polymer-forming cytoskeletal protein [Bacteroidia bacterium]
MGSNKNQSVDATTVNLIRQGTKINGDINSAGDIRIDGHLVGNLIANGKFVLGPNGLIEGNVTSTNAELEGEVKGIVSVTEMLALKSTAKINGDIITNRLAIEPGAVFNGSCNMGAKVKNMVHNPEMVNASKTA